MKLLFDQNLSHHLAAQLAGEFPGSIHVRDIGMATAPDTQVWACAAANGFAIVSKDADFQQRAMLYGHPPKVIWLRAGNCSTSLIHDLLRARREDMEAFFADADSSFLVLSPS